MALVTGKYSLKAVIVGDSDVLKMHFSIQIAGVFDRDRVSIDAYIPDHPVDFMIYNKVGRIAICNNSKSIVH